MSFYSTMILILGIFQIIGGLTSIIRGLSGASPNPVRAVISGIFILLFGLAFSVLPYIKNFV